MPERIVTYETWEERQALCTEAEAIGESMIRDEIRDGINTLVFDVRGPFYGLSLAAARVKHMNLIQRVRNRRLQTLDLSFMKALETGDTSAQGTIATQKQVLRDIPATFDITTGVDTPEKLKAKWPTELLARE